MSAARAVAALMLVALLGACGGSPASSGGTGQFGAADQPSASASTSPGADPNDGLGFTFSPSPAPSGSGSVGSGDLRASYKVDKSLLGAKAKVTVTLTNNGPGDVDGWTVIMTITGLTLALTVPDQVKHEVQDGKHVFTPNGQGAQLRPGDTLGFEFSATGLGSVTSCTANGRDCTSA